MVFISLLLMVFYTTGSQKTCSDVNMFSNLVHGKYLGGYEFLTIPDITLLVCVRHCQIRRRCKSINLQRYSGDCILNEGDTTPSSLNVTNSTHNVYSEIDGWRNVLTDACASHTCPETTECRDTGNESYNCVVVSCVDPPDVSNAQITSSSRFIEVGSIVPYLCDVPYIPAGERTCLPNGSWDGEFDCQKLTSCSMVKVCNSSYADGEYWIYAKDGEYTLLKVYCHNMARNPTEFITLQGETYSDLLNKTLAEKCGVSWHEKYCGKTVFNKVRIKPWRMHLVDYNYKFAESDCLHSPIGYAGDCSLCQDEPIHGSFRIDTSGTGLKVADRVFWISNNGTLTPTWNKTNGGTVITGECRGGCEYCRHDTTVGSDIWIIPMEIDSTYIRNLSEATFPQCSTTSL